jgi:hypothetical protein
MESRLGENFIQKIKQDGFIDVKNKKGELWNVNICQSFIHLSFADYTKLHVLVNLFLILCSFAAMNVLHLC